MAEKIVEALHEPFHLEGALVHVGGSLGIALYPDHGQDASLLMRAADAADAAMYVAKRSKTGFTVYTPGQEQSGPQDALTYATPHLGSGQIQVAV